MLVDLTVEITLHDYLNVVNLCICLLQDDVKKGIKLDFKQLGAVKESLEILGSHHDEVRLCYILSHSPRL